MKDSAQPGRTTEEALRKRPAASTDTTSPGVVEKALRQSESRFRSLMEQAPYSVQILSPDGRTVEVNSAWSQLWGVTLDQLAGYNMLEDAQLEAKGILPLIRRAFAGEVVRLPPIAYDPNETLPGLTANSDPVRWVSATAYPLKDENGQVTEVVLVHNDITKRRRAEEALQRSEERLRLLIDTIPQLAWIARADGYIEWYNRRWYDYTGTTPGQMEGWGWQSVHHPEVLDEVMERWTLSISTGEPFDMVFPIKGADGQFRPFLTRVNPLRDADGAIVNWFGTNTDVTEIKAMEQALRDSDQRKDEFLATLAHELRNPLAPIATSLTILNMPQVEAVTAQKMRDIIQRQFQHLTRLVDDLLDVSRVSRGTITLRKQRVELSAVVAQAVETAQPLIDKKGHHLEVSITDEPLFLMGDSVRLVQVVSNLLNNAAKYTQENGRIGLSLSRENEHAALRVKDNGSGIAAELLPHVFGLFVQADREAVRSQGGLGIGLTLAKSLTEQHGGTIEAHSDGLGKGTEFVVRLPLMQQDEAASEKA